MQVLFFLEQLRIAFFLILCLQQEEDLSDLIMKVIKQGLEGLVLKDTKVPGIYMYV